MGCLIRRTLPFSFILLLKLISCCGKTENLFETTIIYGDNDVTEAMRGNGASWAPNTNHLRTGLHGIVFETTAADDLSGYPNRSVKVLLSDARDQSVLLQEQPDGLTLSKRSSNDNILSIEINPAKTYQSMEGFGYSLTEGAAEEISRLSKTEQNNLLNDIFGSSKTGNNISIIRISIGASDLSTSLYTYNDTPHDYTMLNFTLSGPDLTYVIPLVKRIQEINPVVKVLCTPWTAPIWMKDNNDWVGGTLLDEAYDAYARYFVRYVEEMAKEGIHVWAITPQNEPENPHNTPSMEMSADAQLLFVHHHLGPAFDNAGLDTKIFAWDHNCDNPGYAIHVANGSRYVQGSAFHLYGGDISAMSDVRYATNKDVYFTEQWTSKNGDFDGDFGWHMTWVVVGSMRNWSRSVLEWTLATLPEDKTLACPKCLGAITVNQDGQGYQRHVSYYVIGHIAKYVDPGAVRIYTNDLQDEQLHNVAVQNTDKTIVLLVYNSAPGKKNFKVKAHGEVFEYALNGRSAVTFKWNGK
mmetsp:Transcript_26048/g.38514  ORF Transcript_26048/g.38514 Transcript_26048/m.38514 type:complete len:524 (+) Transcript_26048:51-1622(+)